MSNNSYNFYPRLDGLQLIEADSITTSDLTTNTLTANSFKTNLVQSINATNNLTLEALTTGQVIIKSNGTNIAIFDTANNLITLNARVSQVRSDSATSYGSNCVNNSVPGTGTTAFGTNALRNVGTTGFFNCAFGESALQNCVDGDNNCAFGLSALFSNVSGSGNMAIGLQALRNATSNSNCCVGVQSGLFITNGVSNVCIGNATGGASTAQNSSNNTFIGLQAGYGQVAGSATNTCIGFLAGNATWGGAYSNSSCLGANTVITASNQITLGTPTQFTTTGNMSIGKTTAPTTKFDVEGNSDFNGLISVRNGNNLQIFNNGNTRQTNCYMFNNDLYVNNVAPTGTIAFQINTSSIASIASTAINSNVYITVPNEPALSNNGRCANTAYVDTAITTALTGLPTLSGSNTWTGTNLFANNIPTISTLLTPTTSQQLINLGFSDGRYAQLASSNTFTGLLNTFNSSVAFGTQAPTCSFAPTLNSSLANKLYVDTAYQTGQEATSVIYLYDDFLSNNSDLPSSISGGWIFNGTGSATWAISSVKEHPGIWTLGNNRAIGFLSNIPTYLPKTIEWIARITSATNVFTLYAGIAQGYSVFTNSAFFGHTSGTTTLYASINNVNLYNFTTVTWLQNKWYSYKITFNNPDVTFTIKNITDNLTETYTATASSFNFATNLFPQYQQIGTMTSEVDYFAFSYQAART